MSTPLTRCAPPPCLDSGGSSTASPPPRSAQGTGAATPTSPLAACAMPAFSMDDISDTVDGDDDDDGHGCARVGQRCSAGGAAQERPRRRSRLRRVRWLPHGRVVVFKEVHLCVEDCVSEDVGALAARLWRLRADALHHGRADVLLEYLALHVDSRRHYQWLLRSCGPSLRDLVSVPPATPLDEHCSGRLLRRVLLALDQLHRVSLCVHGDVSLGNVLTTSSSDTALVVLGDLESVCPIDSVPRACVGSYMYTAPERLVDGGLPLAPSDDVWALGIVAYQLLTWCTEHPWRWCAAVVACDGADNYWALLELLSAAKELPPQELLLRSPLSRCSPNAQSFVKLCLSWTPTERPTAAELLEHRWIVLQR